MNFLSASISEKMLSEKVLTQPKCLLIKLDIFFKSH